MDDFLWDCALDVNNSKDRFDIIPDYEDDMRQFGCITGECSNSLFVLKLASGVEVEDINVQIVECRNNGVLDIIGGELWEGALLLCAYILAHKSTFLNSGVMELGSGVGLPGLLLTALKLKEGPEHGITLTDNDHRVVSNLNTAIKKQFDVGAASVARSSADCLCTTVKVSTRILDWSIFKTGTELSAEAEVTLQETAADSAILMGCELCYAPYHAQCLANLLKAYISTGQCQQVVIIQMRDREGFPEFLNNLSTMALPYCVEEISDELYDAAQEIECNNSANISTSKKLDEAGVTTKTFVFKSNQETGDSKPPIHKKGLQLRSPKGNFVIVRIGCIAHNTISY